MDALDECAEQEELLTFLSQLLDKDFYSFRPKSTRKKSEGALHH
jgi:hypothetical protein